MLARCAVAASGAAVAVGNVGNRPYQPPAQAIDHVVARGDAARQKFPVGDDQEHQGHRSSAGPPGDHDLLIFLHVPSGIWSFALAPGNARRHVEVDFLRRHQVAKLFGDGIGAIDLFLESLHVHSLGRRFLDLAAQLLEVCLQHLIHFFQLVNLIEILGKRFLFPA